MDNRSDLINALWSEFSEFVLKGLPVYFTFTRDLLEEVFIREGIHFQDPGELIDESVRTLIDVSGNHVFLKKHALKANEDGLSPAILFVCQQILAVEEMISTEHYSENAYFPHLRRSLSNQLDTISQNPFDYQEFEEIWRTLSKEIFKQSHNSKCLTFTLEQTSGVNKAKRFPLSQALFSKQDSVRLIEAIGYRQIRSSDEQALFRRIISNKHILSKRGKRLTSYPWMRDALVRQIRSLSRSVGEVEAIKEVLSKRSLSLESLVLKVYLDNVDWFSNEHVVNLFDSKNNLISDTSVIHGFFTERVSNNNYCVFIPSDDGDCWLVSDTEYLPAMGDELIVSIEPANQKDVLPLLSDYFGTPKDSIRDIRIHRSRTLHAFKLRIGENFNKKISVKSGTIYVLDHDHEEDTVEFIGGILIDSRQTRFSCLCMPSGVVCSGKEYPLEGTIKINGALHDFENFRREVKSLISDESFSIELVDGAKFILKLAPLFKKRDREVKYPIFRKQVLPVVGLVRRGDQGSKFEGMPTYLVNREIKHYLEERNYPEMRALLNEYQLSDPSNST